MIDRKLRLETLEDRRVLASVVVTNNLDIIDGDTSSLTALQAAPGDDGISIREAIEAANNTPGGDEITFDFGHDGPEVILLTEGELLIADSLTITGDGPELLAIDAQQQSRVINSVAGDLQLKGLTIQHGHTTGDIQNGGDYPDYGGGAGIHVSYLANGLFLEDCVVTGNSTEGLHAGGGGIHVSGTANLSLEDSVVTGNSTAGDDAAGGGIWSVNPPGLLSSRITGNSTSGDHAEGGGIWAFYGVFVVDSTISGNSTSGEWAGGGGIALNYSVDESAIFRSTISNNSTLGNYSRGGGFYWDASAERYGRSVLRVEDSIFEGNFTTGSGAAGGALWSSTPVSITRSKISGNNTFGDGADGGAIAGGGGFYGYFPSGFEGWLTYADITLVECTVTANSTWGDSASGGAIYNRDGDLDVVRSEISGNMTQGLESSGGGIYTYRSTATIHQSTVSGNSTTGDDAGGGGIASSDYTYSLNIRESTVVGNCTHGNNSPGGGINFANFRGFPLTMVISNSIVSGNQTHDGNGPELFDPDAVLDELGSGVSYSLIGNSTDSGIDENTGVGNLLDVDPHLGPLADHGGPTLPNGARILSHALLPGSPAIDAGDPSVAYDPLEYDQRGEGFARVANGGSSLRIDMGAYESQGVPDYPVGDYNYDGIASLADYVLWRNTLGSTANLGADGSGNDIVDAADYTVWREHFGNTTIPLTPVETPTDAAFALFVSPDTEDSAGDPATMQSSGSGEASADNLLLLWRATSEDDPQSPAAAWKVGDDSEDDGRDDPKDSAVLDQSLDELPILR